MRRLALGQLRQVLAVDQDPPRGDVVVPGHDVDQRALAGSGRPADADRLPGSDVEGVVAQHQAVRHVTEVDVLELDPPALELVVDGVGSVDDVGSLVDDAEDAVAAGRCVERRRDQVGHLGERGGEQRRVAGEGQHGSDVGLAANDEEGPGDQHEDVLNEAQGLRRRELHQRRHERPFADVVDLVDLLLVAALGPTAGGSC